MKHSENWYQRRLQKYFDEHFEPYEETAEYYVDPAPNKWRFIIPELGLVIQLTCSDEGVISCERTQSPRHVER